MKPFYLKNRKESRNLRKISFETIDFFLKKGNLLSSFPKVLLLMMFLTFLGGQAFAQAETEPNDDASDNGVITLTGATTITGTAAISPSADYDIWLLERPSGTYDLSSISISNINFSADLGVHVYLYKAIGSYTATPTQVGHMELKGNQASSWNLDYSQGDEYYYISILARHITDSYPYNLVITGNVWSPPTCPPQPEAVSYYPTTNSNQVLSLENFVAPENTEGYLIKMNTVNYFSPVFDGVDELPASEGTVYGSGEQVVFAQDVAYPLAPSFQVTGLQQATQYFIAVYPYSKCGNSQYDFAGATVMGFSTCNGNAPSPVTAAYLSEKQDGFVIDSMGGGGIANFSSIGYVVKVNTTNSFTAPTDGTSLPAANVVYSGSGEQVVYSGGSKKPNVTVSGMSAGTTYYVKVYSYSQCGSDFSFESVGYSTSIFTCATPLTGANSSIQAVGGSIDIYELSPAVYQNNSVAHSGLLVYINDVNNFTDPEAQFESLPIANSKYSGSGQQLVKLESSISTFVNVTGLTPNTTYYFKSYPYYYCDGTTYVNLTDVRETAITTCNFSDNLASNPVFGAISGNSMELSSFTALTPDAPATAPDGYIIRINTTNNFSSYAHGIAIPTGDPAYGGSGEQVIYVGNSTNPNLNISGLSANTKYYFNIVAYYPACGIPSVIRYQQSGYTFSKSNDGTTPPEITFTDLYKSVGGEDFNLNATASDGSTISYQIMSQTGFGTSLSGTNNETVSLGNVGTVVIEASANGATALATLTITELAVSGTYFMDDADLYFLDNDGVISTQASFNGGVNGTAGCAFDVLDGAVWFTSSQGGANDRGVFVRQNPDGSSPDVYDIPASTQISNWHNISSVDGKIWLSTAGSAGAEYLISRNPDGTNSTVVHTFTGTDLYSPCTGLVEFNGVLYGAAYTDITNSAGGIYSLTPDGSGGYIYAVEHTFTSSDVNRNPLYGMALHDNLIWYSNIHSRLVAYDPVTKTFPRSLTLSGTGNNPIVANNEIYVYDGLYLQKVINNNMTLESVFQFGDDRNWDRISFDGEYIYGISKNFNTSLYSIYKLKPDGTGFELMQTNSVANYPYLDKAVNIISKATTGVVFPDKSVVYGNTVTLESQTNSTGARTYELIGDVTGSSISGDQFTAGNTGTVTIRVTVAEDGNFEATSSEATYTIIKGTPSFLINDFTVPFQNPPRALNPVSTNYPGTPVYQFVDGASLVSTGPNTSATISGNILTFVNPGTETIRATLPETSNFNESYVDFQFTTEKKSLEPYQIIINSPASLNYDANPMVFTVTPNVSMGPGITASEFEITYEGRNGTVYTSTTTAPTDAGDYTVIASVKESNSYYQGSNSANFTITPAATTIDLNLPVANPVYTGSEIAITPFANDVDGNPTLQLLIEYSVQGAGTFSETAPVNAGTYDVRVNLAAGETNYTAAEATGTYTIDKVPQAITFNVIPVVACSQASIDLSLYATSSTGNTLIFSSDNNSIVTVVGNEAIIVGSGSAIITASQAGDINTEAAISQQQTIAINAIQESYSVDNPADVLTCDGSEYILPALTEGNYFSGPGATGTVYNVGDIISASMTMYVYGMSSTSNACTDENSFEISINNLPVDNLPDVTQTGSYTLPALVNGNYYTGTGGTGSALSAGDAITSSQTIYIYNTDAGTGCTRESSFDVTIETFTALHFEQVSDFVNSDYLSVPDDNSLDFTDHFTFEAWVNFDQLTVTAGAYSWRSFFQKSRYTDSYGLMALAYEKRLRFYHTGVGAGITDYIWTDLTAGTWHHVAVKWDATNSKTSILIDGVEVSSNTSVTGTLAVNTLPLLIGASRDDAGDPYPFDGAMDEIRLWNYARTDTEIHDNKDVKLTGNEPGLVLYYNFEEGTINGDNSGLTQVPDRSGNNNHGTYHTFALTGSTSNYVDGTGNGVGIGTPQAITFNALSDKTYGDADYTLGATASSGLTVSYTSSNTSVATVSGNTVTIVGAGSTDIYASQPGDATYGAAANVKHTLTVNPIALEITADDKSKYLSHADPELTYNITNGSLINGDQLSGSLEREAGETSGTYAINQGTLTAGTNYSISFVPGVFTIESVSPQTISFAPITNPAYGDTILTGVTASSGLDVTLTSSDPAIARVSNDTIFMDNVGTVTITASQAGNAAFLAAPDSVISFTVGPKLITAVPKDTTIQYGALYLPTDGTLDYPIAFKGLVKTSDTSTFENWLPNVRAYVSDLSTPTVARTPGTYDLVWDGTNKPAFTDNSGKYNIATSGAGTVTVIAAPVTVKADSITKVYDKGTIADPALTYTVNSSGLANEVGTIDYSSDFALSGALTRTAGDNVGVYPINQGTLTAGTNYAINFTSDDFVIIKDTVTVELNPLYVGLQYGEDYPVVGNPLLIYSGFASDDTEASLNTLPVLSTIVNTTTDAGIYPYTIDGGVDNNYAFNYVNGDITVSKRGLLVTVDNLTLTYGDPLPTDLDYTVTGFVNGEDTSVFTTHPVMGYNTSPKDVGTYNSELKLVTTFQADNYFWIGEARGTLTINKKDLTVTPEDATLEYGAIGANDYPVTYSGFQYGEDESVLTIGVGSPTVTFIDETSPTLFYDAGATYANAIKVEASSQAAMTGSNYNLIFETGQLTVTQRPITFTADAKSKIYGDADPTFTVQLTAGSFANGDTINNFGFNRVSGEDVGSYFIDSLGVTLKKSDDTDATANYDITYVGDNLNITHKSIIVAADPKTKTYGENDPILSYFLVSGALVGADVLSGSLTRLAGEDVGTYAITQGTLDNSNYAITFISDNLSIGKKAIQITADAKSKTYGDSDPTFTYQITSGSLVGSDTFIGSLTRTTGENVGAYAINQGTVSAGSNYNLSFVSSDLTIDTKAIEVTADAISKTYGDADPALTYTITFGALVGSDTFSGTLSRAAGEDVGTYAVSQNTLALSSNYDLSFVDQDFTITNKAIEITADAANKTYGDADPAFTYQITTGALVGSDAFTGSLSRVAGENAGDYAIEQGTVSAGSNYNLSFVSNNLTIDKRQLTVKPVDTTMYYGVTVINDYPMEVVGFVNGDGLADITYNPDVLTANFVKIVDFVQIDQIPGPANYVFPVGTYSNAIYYHDALPGSYTYLELDISSPNYTFVNGFGNVTVVPMPVTVSATAQTKTYGDSDPTLTYATSHATVSAGATYRFSEDPMVFTGALSRTAGEDIGDYAISQNDLALSSNYTLSFVSENLTIEQRSIEVTANDKTKFEGSADPAFDYTFTNGSLAFSDVLTGSLTRVAGETIGNYAINQGSLAATANYNMSFVPGTLTITDLQTQTITFAALANVTYGDADFNLTATGGASGNPITFTSSDETVATVSGSTVTIVGAGTTVITASQAGNATYAAAADVNRTLTVDPIALTVRADAKNKTYGELDPELTYQITSGALIGSDVFTGNLIRVTGENVGTYIIEQGSLDNDNYDISYIGDNFTITQRFIELTADLSSKTYGDADPVFTYQVTTGTVIGSDVFTGDMIRTTGEDVGTYTISQGTLDNSNYDISFVENDFIINPRPLEITADAASKVYGDTDPAFTYQITSGSLVGIDAFVGSLTRTMGEDVGTYAIEQGTVSAGANYNLSFVSGDLTIGTKAIEVSADAISKIYGETDPALTYSVTIGSLVGSDTFTGSLIRTAGEDVGTYAITQNTLALSSNYSLSFVGNNLTVTQRSIEVTANDITKFEGSADPALTYSITNGNLVFSNAINGTPERVAGETVGTYAINQGTVSAGANYNMNFVPGTFTITDLMLQTITFDALAGVTYGDTDLTLTATGGDSGNPITYTSSDETVATVSGNTVTIIGVGSTVITASQAGNATYAAADNVPQTLTVNPKAIEVTADALSKSYGDTDPALTYIISNGSLVGSDAFTGSLSRIAGETVGTYVIEQNTLALSSNYTLNFVSNNLTIAPKAIEVTADVLSKTYGDVDPVLTYTINNGSLVGSDTFTGNISRVAGESAGTYAIEQNTLALNNNYALSFISNDLTITQKAIEITADALTKTYGDTDPVFTYQITSGSLIGSDSFEGSLSRTAGEDVGTYAISQGTLDNSNYNITYISADLTIAQKSIDITANALSKIYGDTDPAFTYQITSGSLVGSDILSGSLSRTVGEDVGTYAILQGTLDNSNYNLTFVSADLTIGQKAIEITAGSETKVCGESDPEFTYQVTNGALVGSDAFSGSLSRVAGEDIGTYAIEQGTLSAGSNYTLSYVSAELTITMKETTIYPVICLGDEYISPSGNIYKETGVYTETVSNSTGCDSIVVIDLTVNEVLNTVTVSGTAITADETDATYQWLNCDDNYSVIDGETSQSFTAYISGNYALRVEKNGCVDTSECITITVTGIESIFSNTINIYPNPTNGQVNIDFEKTVAKFNVNVRDVTGKLVRHESYVSASEARFYFEGHQGVYFIEIYTDSERKIFKIIKSE